MAGIFCREEDDEFLHFTVGGYPRQSASRQGLLPTAEQICCTVGNNTAQNSLGGMGVPTVNCRKSGTGYRNTSHRAQESATGHRKSATGHRKSGAGHRSQPQGTGTQATGTGTHVSGHRHARTQRSAPATSNLQQKRQPIKCGLPFLVIYCSRRNYLYKWYFADFCLKLSTSLFQ